MIMKMLCWSLSYLNTKTAEVSPPQQLRLKIHNDLFYMQTSQ